MKAILTITYENNQLGFQCNIQDNLVMLGMMEMTKALLIKNMSAPNTQAERKSGLILPQLVPPSNLKG